MIFKVRGHCENWILSSFRCILSCTRHSKLLTEPSSTTASLMHPVLRELVSNKLVLLKKQMEPALLGRVRKNGKENHANQMGFVYKVSEVNMIVDVNIHVWLNCQHCE